MSIGTNISELRRAKGLTQQQLAEKLGVSGQSVSKWENDVCAPDVGQFPLLAELFGVSIDRLYGFRLSDGEEVRTLVDKADRCETLKENIAMLKSGLERFPNSPQLKIALATSWLSAWRTGLGGVEKEEAREKCMALCREVERSCGDRALVDSALDLMSRAYRESGDFETALACLDRLSVEAYGLRLVGKADVLLRRGDHAALERFGERELLDLWQSAYFLLSALSDACAAGEAPDKALAFADAGERLLTLFDAGCEDFFSARKLWAAEKRASLCMAREDRKGCLEALSRFVDFAEQSKNAGSGRHLLSERNPLFFSSLHEVEEEWISAFPAALLLKKYEAFFGEDEAFLALRKKTEKSGKDA
jgi:transcriptional regulator with XRE-family HTH domain